MRILTVLTVFVCMSQMAHAQFALTQKISATGQVISKGQMDRVEDAKAVKAFDSDIAYTTAWDAWASPKMTPKDFNQATVLEKLTNNTVSLVKKNLATANAALDAAQGFLNEASTALVAGDTATAIKKHADASKELFFYSKFRGYALMDAAKTSTHHGEWRKILEKYPVPNN